MFFVRELLGHVMHVIRGRKFIKCSLSCGLSKLRRKR